MTLKLGALQADIEVDTSDLKKADKEIKNTANTLDKEFKKGGDSASKSIENTGKVATGAFKNIRGAAGNVGFQLQDIAVQAQAGTNSLVILGQQGSQILGAFGPAGAIAGAVLAIGAAIGTALVPALFDSKDATDALDEALEALGETATTTESGIAVLTKEIIELAKESEAAARVAIKGGIVAGLEAIEQAGKGVEQLLGDALPSSLFATGNAARGLENRIERFAEKTGLSAEQVKILVASLRSIREDKSEDNIARIQEQIDQMVSSSEKATPAMIELANSTREYSSKAAEGAEAVQRLKDSQDNLNESLKESEELLNSDSGSGEAFQKFVDRRIAQLETLGETELEAINRIAEERKAFVLANDQREGDERLALLEKIEGERLSRIEDLGKREADTRLAQQKQALSEQNQAISQGAAAIGNIFETLGNDQASSAAKLISSVAQTAISISTLMFAQSKAQGLADPTALTLPQKIANVAALTSAFAGIFSSLKGAKSGGRQFGGSVSPGLATPINEGGVPEILNQGNQQFLLPTGKSGSITPLSDSGGSMGTPTVNILSTGSPQTVDSVSFSRGEVSIMISDAMNSVKSEINTSLATGRGDTARSVQSGFKLERNLR